MPTSLSDLPPDVVLKICGFCTQWKDVFTLRKVSKMFDAFFHQREIWTDLVSACVNPANDPPVCFIERPLYTYSIEDLQRVFKRWKISEIGLKTLSSQKAECAVRTLGMEYPMLVSSWSLLSPGGRWLISFTQNVAGVYYDLDSRAPEPFPIIPSQLSANARLTDVYLSEFDVDEDSPYLTFRVAFSYNPDEADKLVNVVQIWEIGVIFDHVTQESRLVAHRLNLFRLKFGRIRIISLVGNYLLLNAGELDIGDEIFADEKLLLLDWSTVPEDKVAPVKLVLFNSHYFRRPSLLRNGAVVRSTVDGIFLYDFADLEYYTGALPDSVANLYVDRISPCYHKPTIIEGDILPMLSNPFYFRTCRGITTPQRQAEIILLDQNGMGSIRIDDFHTRVYGREEADLAPAAPYRLLGRYDKRHRLHNFSDSEYFMQIDEIIFGHRHTLARINDRLHLLSVAETPEKEMREEGDVLVASDLGISASFNQFIHFDESIGRIVVSSEDRELCKIYDLFV